MAHAKLARNAFISLLAFLALAAVCLGFFHVLETPRPRGQAENYKNIWFLCYVVLLLALSTCISFASCAMMKSKTTTTRLGAWDEKLKKLITFRKE
jgi:magnesium-transporting ATPase (P-type)